MIDLRRITRTFPAQERKSPPLPVLSDITLRIPPGQYAAMVGASGSGKSTLMNILGCLDRPTSGVYRLHGRDVSSLPPDELAKVRGEEIGELGGIAAETLADQLTKAGSTSGVDAVAGATMTSDAVFTAMDNCLSQAE